MLLTYESDAKSAQAQGKPVFYAIPKATLQIETPLAAVNTGNKARGDEVRQLALHAGGADDLGQNGFRPVDLNVLRKYKKQFPPRPQLFKIGYVGGWNKVNTQFFDPDERDHREDRAVLGVSTGG